MFKKCGSESGRPKNLLIRNSGPNCGERKHSRAHARSSGRRIGAWTPWAGTTRTPSGTGSWTPAPWSAWPGSGTPCPSRRSAPSRPTSVRSSLDQNVYSGSQIRVFPSRIRIFFIPHPGSASKNLKYFNPKNCFLALGNMIQVVHPRSGSWFLPIPGPGVKKEPDPGSESATLIKTA